MRLAGIALCGAVLAALVKQYTPPFALLTAAVCGVVMLAVIARPFGEILHTLTAFLRAAGIDGDIYIPVVKAVGIAVVVRITSEICRDAGQSALASRLELAGTVAATAVCIPLMQQIFALLSELMGS